jgi:chemotaxis protein histidine kinase CheA
MHKPYLILNTLSSNDSRSAKLDQVAMSRLGGTEKCSAQPATAPIDPNQLPDIILLIVNETDDSAKILLNTLKRNPLLHHIGVFVVLSSFPEHKHWEAEGVFSVLNWEQPATEWSNQIALYQKQKLAPADLTMLEEGFADDALDQIQATLPLIKNLNLETMQTVYRTLHTLKGGARSLQYLELGRFIHSFETSLSAAKNANLFGSDRVELVFLESLLWVQDQIIKIKKKILLDAIPQKLVNRFQWIQTSIDENWAISATSESSVSTTKTTTPIAEPKSEKKEASSAPMVRIANEKMQELHERFKKILQIRVKLSHFATMLQQEFSDESFPRDLSKLISDLMTETSQALEFFISLRVVSANRLKNYSQRILNETMKALAKDVHLDYQCDETLELDQTVIEILEAALTHLIRNSVDHGIEPKADRTQKGKNEIGTIKINLQKDGRERFLLRVEDDGKGIMVDKLKAAIQKKGFMTPEALAQMSNEQACELIFLDGLSTQDSITEVSGRGVGLGAVKQRIEQGGGNLSVKTIVGQGTIFDIRMPRFFQL